MRTSRKTLAGEHPQLVLQWHPTKNGDLTPADVSPGLHRKVWWRCERGHEWQAQINARVRGTGCPVCANRQIVVGENDLATTHPEIAAQWHPTRNAPATPQEIFAGSHFKVWWICEQGHEYQSLVHSRAVGKNGCPVCAGKQILQGENDLSASFPNIAAQWHPTKNGDLRPGEVTPFSNRRVWWQCEKGHEYRAVIASRVKQAAGCPYCTNRKVLAGFNDLATIHPEIAAQWHPELNGLLTPQMVTPGSSQKVWWQCSLGHVWKAVVFSRTGSKPTDCPVCAGNVRKKQHNN